MRIDFSRHFKTFDGKDTTETMADVIAQALFNHGNAKPVSADTKYQAYRLSQQILRNPTAVHILTEDATLIKEVCSEVLTAGGYGQVYETIENPQND